MQESENRGIKKLFSVWKNKLSLIPKEKRRGISLAEILIALVLLGVLTAILMPVLKSARPDKLEALHKKGNYIVEHIVSDIAFDDDLYSTSKTASGLGNLGSVTIDGTTYAGDTKFCELFASRANKAPGSNANCVAGQKTFTSVEGIDWYLPVSTFDGSIPYEEIKYDVNGTQAPNCSYNADSCPKPDMFTYFVKPNGKLYTNEPNQVTSTYCINVVQVGAGNVTMRPASGGIFTGANCGKAPGSYELKAIPIQGWESDWTSKTVSVVDRDVTVNVNFTLIPPPEMRQIVITKVRNFSLLEGIFNSSKKADGVIKLGDETVGFSGSGRNGCYSWGIFPGCTIFETTLEVEAGQYSLYAVGDSKSMLDAITPGTTLDVTSNNASAQVSFVWVDYDDQKFNVGVNMAGSDNYCVKSSVSGTLNLKPKNTDYKLTANPQPADCTWVWTMGDPSLNSGTSTDRSIGGKIKDANVTIPIRFIAPPGAVDPDPIKHNVIVNQICPDGSSMCATVTGAGAYAEHTSGINLSVAPYAGLSADWTSMSVNMGTADVVVTVTMTEGKYCINTEMTGSGTVQPSKNYCGLGNGTYQIKAIPAAAWDVKSTGWSEFSKNPLIYSKQITIAGSDVNTSVIFAKKEDRSYNAKVTMTCQAGTAPCAKFTISSPTYPQASLDIAGNTASKGGLPNGDYDIVVTPDTGYMFSDGGKTAKKLVAKIDNADAASSVALKSVCAKYGIGAYFVKDLNKCFMDFQPANWRYGCNTSSGNSNSPECTISGLGSPGIAYNTQAGAYKSCQNLGMALPSYSQVDSIHRSNLGKFSVVSPRDTFSQVYTNTAQAGSGSQCSVLGHVYRIYNRADGGNPAGTVKQGTLCQTHTSAYYTCVGNPE